MYLVAGAAAAFLAFALTFAWGQVRARRGLPLDDVDPPGPRAPAVRPGGVGTLET